MSKFGNSVQIRVYEEELRIILDRSNREECSMQIALSKIIREWELAKNVKEHSGGSQ